MCVCGSWKLGKLMRRLGRNGGERPALCRIVLRARQTIRITTGKCTLRTNDLGRSTADCCKQATCVTCNRVFTATFSCTRLNTMRSMDRGIVVEPAVMHRESFEKIHSKCQSQDSARVSMGDCRTSNRRMFRSSSDYLGSKAPHIRSISASD